ncbi:MAG: hypothetical protein K6F27_07325, partial [Ruminococcus sp.]|nr:hypothetical protein [Ruminococcus sp.]
PPENILWIFSQATTGRFTPIPKPFIAFSAQGVCDTLSRKSSRVQKKEFERKRSQENTHSYTICIIR